MKDGYRLGRLRLVVPLLDNPKNQPLFGSLYVYLDRGKVTLDRFCQGEKGGTASVQALQVIKQHCIDENIPFRVRHPTTRIGEPPNPVETGIEIDLE